MAIGNHGEEKPFPGISGTEALIPEDYEQPYTFFGCEIVTLLELSEGYHDLSVTASPQHELYLGFGPNAFLIDPDESINPGKGDDQGWRYRFMVPQSGLYPFTLLFFDDLTGSSTLTTSGGSASSLEWSVKSPLGTTPLINAPVVGSIKAYIPEFAADRQVQASIELNSMTAQSFSFNTLAGSNYLIEGSGDLRQWKEIAQLRAEGDSTTFRDDRETSSDVYFYRVRLP